MVTGNTTSTPEAEAPSPGGADQLEIIDNTTPETLAAERAWEASEEVEIGSDDGDQEEPQDTASEGAEQPETPAPQSEQPAAEAPKQETAAEKKQRLYSEEEWRKQQSAYDRQVAEERRLRQEAEKRASEFDMNAQVEAYRQQQQSTLEQQGYGSDEARRMSQTGAEMYRGQLQAQQQRSQIEEQMRQQQEQLEEAAKRQTAQMLAAKHGVEAETLLTQGTPQAMVALAEQMGEAAKLRKEIEELKQQRVPAGTTLDSGEASQTAPPDEHRLLDEYNRGSRSPAHMEAARQAAGR